MTAATIARTRMVSLGLWSPLGDPGEVVSRLTAMQSQEHRYARWSVAQRCGATAAQVDRAFDDGQILRTHVLRPTWHYVAPCDIRWLVALSGPILNRRNQRRYGELGLDAGTCRRGTDAIVRELADGPLTRKELVRRLEARGIGTEGQRMPYLLIHAEIHGAICSGPMKGNEHTYTRLDDRVPPASGPQGDEALAELARRYFATRGPATAKDFAWWAGLNATHVDRALTLVRDGFEVTVLDGRTYFGAGPGPVAPSARADLVQCYDEVIIAYTRSRDVLTSAGVAFPVPRFIDGFSHVVLFDGRVIGHWRIGRGRDRPAVETRLQPGTGEAGQRAVANAVARYTSFLGTRE